MTQSTVWKTLDNNDLNQIVASSGFSENKGLGLRAQSRGLIKPGLGHSYLRISQQCGISLGSEEI